MSMTATTTKTTGARAATNVTITPTTPSTYDIQLEQFRQKLTDANKIEFSIEFGRKYDKLYTNHLGSKSCWYMVMKPTAGSHEPLIYGVKSWAMINLRRFFGELSTLNEWNWEGKAATPIRGTKSYNAHLGREQSIIMAYGKRGRPRKSASLASLPPSP